MWWLLSLIQYLDRRVRDRIKESNCYVQNPEVLASFSRYMEKSSRKSSIMIYMSSLIHIMIAHPQILQWANLSEDESLQFKEVCSVTGESRYANLSPFHLQRCFKPHYSSFI